MTEQVIVTVNEGKIRGIKTQTAFSGVEYYSFLGVPYGQSTEGPARFKDPIKVKPWKSILDATVGKTGCIQFSLHHKKLIGSEDCLYNNIYTPKLPLKGDPLKAVIVNIHPGGFFHGSPDPWYYGAPDFIMHHDIVYVGVGYRLHILGHLNLHMKSCSGNQSLKDIILSLKWIKENIHVFGGDPENVTLMGSSSGSAILHCLLISPLAEGLYHKAILMGMYVFSPVLEASKDHVPIAYNQAVSIGYNGENSDHKKLLMFYKQISVPQYVLSRPLKYRDDSSLEVFPTTKILPTYEPSENSPIPSWPRDLIASTNRVPIIIGFCEKEAAMAIAILRALKRSVSKSFSTAIRQNEWGWGRELNEAQLQQIQKEVENFYLNGDPIGNASQDTLCDILSDAALSDVYDTLINVISADLPSSVYVYKFRYNGSSGLCGLKTKLEESFDKPLEGAIHAEDFCYWCHFTDTAGTNMGCIQPDDREMIHKFTGLLTTFAKTSNPNDYEGLNVNWKPTTPEHPSHLIIDRKMEIRDDILNGERLEFWHKLKKKFENNCNEVA